MSKNHILILGGIIVIVLSVVALVGGNNQPEEKRVAGTRFPSGISADSTAPISGEVRGTTLTITGATTLSSTLGVSGLATLDAGQLRSYTNSTSTDQTSLTLVEADILNYDTVLMTPNTGSVTFTFPATSTITSFIPTAGDRAEQCWYNATSTADITMTFAAGTGMDFERTATSTTNGSTESLAVQEQNSVCFTFIREGDTDISVLTEYFVDQD